MNVVTFIVTLVIVPMLVVELTDWLPWFAKKMIRLAALPLPCDARPRYIEEWDGELAAFPGGNLSKIIFAARICVGAPATAAAVRGLPSATLRLKPVFDRLVAAFALPFLAFPCVIIIVMIRLHDGGPAIFRQVRIGRDGNEFILYKFRTMVVDAERRKAELLVWSDCDGILFKMRRDPRVTPVGAWLRRWSMDELPQFVNVLLGDMSLVGPRPPLPSEASRYTDQVRRRLIVKPGITGLWQVSGRSDLCWDESVRLDLSYVDDWSFRRELRILCKTVPVVIRGTGAY